MHDCVTIYLGTTGTGKTYKALADITALHNKTHDRGCIIVDSAASPTLKAVPKVATLEEALKAAWGRKAMVRWHPSDENGADGDADFTRLMKAARSGGNVRILVDEASFWYRDPQLLKVVRVWRASNATFYFTGQTIGQDFGQGVLGCNPTFYVGKLTAPRAIEFCERWLRIGQDETDSLGLGEFIERRV